MVQRLFPGDKNYILKNVQGVHRPFLLLYTFKKVRRAYMEFHNPLGIIDSTVAEILSCSNPELENLKLFYSHLAGVYRFQQPDNQLEFLFDGRSHVEKYAEDWKAFYKGAVKDFCMNPNFLRAVLEATVFYPKERKSQLATNRIKAFVDDQFGVKMYKHKGIVLQKSA